MPDEKGNRHVAVIPPREDKNKKYIEEFKQALSYNWHLLPNTYFYKVNFHRFLEVSRTGFQYDVLVAARMSDETDQDGINIFTACDETRYRMGLETNFIISFNSFMAKMAGKEPEKEEEYLEMLRMESEGPAGGMGGIVLTSSTDPVFLIGIISDILDEPDNYLALKDIHEIETQGDFVNHPPGQTQMGFGE